MKRILIFLMAVLAHCHIQGAVITGPGGPGGGGNPIGSASNILNVPVILQPGSATNGAPQGKILTPGVGILITTNNGTNLVITATGDVIATNAQPPSSILTNLSFTGAITNANTNQFTVDNFILTIKNRARVTNELNMGWLQVQAGLTNNGPFNHQDNVANPYNNMRLFSETTPMTNVKRSVIIGDHLGIGAVDDGFMSGILTLGSSFTITNEAGELMADSAFLGGGFHHIRATMDSGILGGHTHKMISAVQSGLIGGSHNIISAENSVINGGFTNRIYGGASVINGGMENEITNSVNSTISGVSNRIASGTNTHLVGNKLTNNEPNTVMAGHGTNTTQWKSTGAVTRAHSYLTAANIAGALSIGPTAVTLTADDQEILITASISRLDLSSDSVVATDRNFTLGGSPRDGQLLFLVWADPTSAGQLAEGVGTHPVHFLAGTGWTPAYRETLTLMYFETASEWVEVGGPTAFAEDTAPLRVKTNDVLLGIESTLNFRAGSGVTITGSTGTGSNVVTIAATGGGATNANGITNLNANQFNVNDFIGVIREAPFQTNIIAHGISMGPYAFTVTADNTSIPISNNVSWLELSSDDTTAASRDFHFSGTPTNGHLLYVSWGDPTSAGRLEKDAGAVPVRLESDWVPFYLDNLVLMYSAGGEEWREVGRSYAGSVAQAEFTFRNASGSAYGPDGRIQMARSATNHSETNLTWNLDDEVLQLFGNLAVRASAGASGMIFLGALDTTLLPHSSVFGGHATVNSNLTVGKGITVTAGGITNHGVANIAGHAGIHSATVTNDLGVEGDVIVAGVATLDASVFTPVYLPSAAVFNLDSTLANIWTVTNAATSHNTINVSNVTTAGQWGRIKVKGSGTATNNNATVNFPGGVTVDWLARLTNSATVSNGFQVISWVIDQTTPTTNATVTYRTEAQ